MIKSFKFPNISKYFFIFYIKTESYFDYYNEKLLKLLFLSD